MKFNFYLQSIMFKNEFGRNNKNLSKLIDKKTIFIINHVMFFK